MRQIFSHIQQSRYAWSIDVCVEDSGVQALSGSGERKIRRDGAFADTPLGAADRYDLFDIGNGSLLG